MHTSGIAQAVSAEQKERRHWTRIKVAIQAELQLHGKEFPIRVKTSDLSVGGCYVEMMFTLEVGTALDVFLWIGGSKLHAAGRVVTQHPQFGNGIQFENMSGADEACLDSYLKLASDEAAQA